jgi:hypothetical protein
VLCNLLCFWIVEFLGLVAPEWFLSSQNFYFVNKYLVFLFSAFKDIFVAHKHTHLVVRSPYLFSKITRNKTNPCKIVSMLGCRTSKIVGFVSLDLSRLIVI